MAPNSQSYTSLGWGGFGDALGFPYGSAGKESNCNAGDLGSIPGSGRSSREGIGYPLQYSWASLVDQLVKNPPAMRETWVRSLGWEDSQEKGKATHSVFWPGEFHGLYSPWGRKESATTEWFSLHFHTPLLSLSSLKQWNHGVLQHNIFSLCRLYVLGWPSHYFIKKQTHLLNQ